MGWKWDVGLSVGSAVLCEITAWHNGDLAAAMVLCTLGGVNLGALLIRMTYKRVHTQQLAEFDKDLQAVRDRHVVAVREVRDKVLTEMRREILSQAMLHGEIMGGEQ